MTTPADLLARELRSDGSRPLITWYDEVTGGRVELSVTTTSNWVAKTAAYLLDEVGVEPGDAISFDFELHWGIAVALLSAWSAGATVDFSGDADRVVVPLDPMGAGLSALVAVYPDTFSPSHAAGEEALAGSPAAPDRARILTTLPLDGTGVGWGLLAPLAASGSVVYAVDQDKAAERASAERVTHTVGIDITGLPRLG